MSGGLFFELVKLVITMILKGVIELAINQRIKRALMSAGVADTRDYRYRLLVGGFVQRARLSDIKSGEYVQWENCGYLER